MARRLASPHTRDAPSPRAGSDQEPSLQGPRRGSPSRGLTVRVGAGESAFFMGFKGAGKTRLVMAFCADSSSVVVLDPTGRADEWPAFGAANGYLITGDP